MKALIEDHPNLINPIIDTLAELEKQRGMYIGLAKDPSLVGAAEDGMFSFYGRFELRLCNSYHDSL